MEINNSLTQYNYITVNPQLKVEDVGVQNSKLKEVPEGGINLTFSSPNKSLNSLSASNIFEIKDKIGDDNSNLLEKKSQVEKMIKGDDLLEPLYKKLKEIQKKIAKETAKLASANDEEKAAIMERLAVLNEQAMAIVARIQQALTQSMKN